MSLASLTIDLVLGLNKFEQDSGKTAQIATRDSERMSKAAQRVSDALKKQAEQAGRTQAEYLAIAAAEAGVTQASSSLLSVLERTSRVSAEFGTNAANGFRTTSTAAEEVAARSKALTVELVKGIDQVTAAYRAQVAAVNQRASTGAITTDDQKVQLKALEALRAQSVQKLKAAADEQRAADAVAIAEQRNADAQIAAARKITDAQNGLTATYREQLLQLRALRDAGAITPQQFKQAGTDLVNKQPVRAQSPVGDAAGAEEVARRAALFDKLRVSVEKANFALAQADTTKQVQQAEAFQRLRDTVDKLNYQLVTQQEREFTAAGDSFIASLQRQNFELGKTAEELLRFQSIRVGRQAEAAPLIQGIGQRNFIADLEGQLAAQQKIRAEFGKTETQILQLRASEQGLSEETSATIARLGALKAANQGLAEAKSRAAATASSNDAFIASLEREALAIGKTRAELIQLDAAQRGLSEKAAPLINQIIAAEANLNKFGRTTKVTQFQLQQLQYTVSDVIASVASGISPLTILAQQGGQVADAFGGGTRGIGNAFKTVLSFITPVRLALGLLGATAGAVAFAFYEGSKQSKAFADAIVLTGNAAGQTEGQFNALVRGLAKTSDSLPAGAVREFGQALISTGQVGPQVFAAAAEAATRYGEATGKTAKEVATDFAGMADDVTKWAVEHNKQLNFLRGPQLVLLRSLQEQGRAVEAQALVYDALNERLRKLEPNLGTIEKTLKTVSSAWKGFWDRAYDIGRNETIEDKLAEVNARIAAQQKALSGDLRGSLPAFSSAPATRDQDPEEVARKKALLDKDQVTRNGLLVEQGRQYAKAQADAADAIIAKEGESSRAAVKSLLVKAKAADEYQDALKTLEAHFRKSALDNTPFSDADQQLARAQVRKRFTSKSAVGDASSERKAILDQDLKLIQDALEREKQALQFNQQELQAIYSSGNLSLKEYYDKKRANIAEGVDKEIAALADEQARIQRELDTATFAKPADRVRVQTLLNESVEKSAQLQRKAAQDIKLANIEQATSFQHLGEQIADYQAQLFQLEGNDFAAAQIRQQQLLVRSAELVRRSGGAVSEEELARQIRATQVLDEFAETQRRLAIVTADANRAEEAYLLRAVQAGKSMAETDNAVYQIRATSLVQLGELADKARELADASSDPRIRQAAEDLALEYAKAAENVDPSLNRLRETGKEIGSTFAEAFGNASSGATTLKKAVEGLGNSLLQISTKALVTQPLEQIFQGYARQVVDGQSGFSDFLKTAFQGGINARGSASGTNAGGSGFSQAKDSAAADGLTELATSAAALVTGQTTQAAASAQQAAALSVQTSAITTNTVSMTALDTAARSAALALASIGGSSSAASASGLFSSTGFGTGSGFGNEDYGAFLAEGTNRVPYDNFRATLHKDEAVVPAKYNPAAGGMSSAAGWQPDERANSRRQIPPITIINQWAAGTTQSTIAQAGVKQGRQVARELGRGTS